MAKNTLSPVRGRNKVITSLDPCWRMALDSLTEELDHDYRSETLRTLIIEALANRGITEQTAMESYLEYKLSMTKAGMPDQYENGEL